MKYEIIDNFLSQEDFKKLKNSMISQDFEWYYNESVADKNSNDNFYFTHNFFTRHAPNSNKIFLIEPIILKIKPLAIIRIKGNFYPKTEKIFEHKEHVDYDFKHNGFIFYVNNNNGFTRLNDGTMIESIENRGLFFEAYIKHNSSTCTDQNGRININFNYF